MATRCAASANCALSTVLRSVFRSELPHDPHLHSVRRLPRPRSLPQHARPFSSTTKHFQIQINPSHTVTAGPVSSATDSSQQTEAKPKDSHPPSREPDSASATEPTQEGQESSEQKKDRRNNAKERKAGNMKKLLKEKKREKPEPWQIQKEALDKKFPAGWNPPKKLSPDALDGIRHLHATAPERFTTAVLAEEFKVSPEAIRRILKSRWKPSEAEMEKRRQRWERRHERIWGQMAELGLRPPTKRSRTLQDSNRLLQEDQE